MQGGHLIGSERPGDPFRRASPFRDVCISSAPLPIGPASVDSRGMEARERRKAEGPRLALTMADSEARFGDYVRALYWSDVAENVLGGLPEHYHDRRDRWQARSATPQAPR